MAAKGKGNLDDLSEPDYDFLSFGFGGEEEEEDDHHPKKPGKNGKKKKVAPDPEELPYILGTLIVRVIAARDLRPARNAHGSIGDFFFGGHGGSNGSANPYASVKFGASTQRTSDIYGTLDPVWPRGETMFMDVSLPINKTTHPDTTPLVTTTGLNNISENELDREDITTPLFESEVSTIITHNNPKNNVDNVESLELPSPVLTVAVFSAGEMGKSYKSVSGSKGKYPNKAGFSGDSDDEFLGMTSVDVTTLLTGKQSQLDCWLPLNGGTGAVRIACEYETTDCPPKKGDVVRFTRFCHPADLYPLMPGRIYPVQEVIDKDHVLLSFTSPEGWVCSFMAHRLMLLCIERHHGAVEAAREEWQSFTERLSHSPLVGTVSQTVERLPEEGLAAVGASIFQGSTSLLGRWLEGGFDTAIKDVAFATNWDGSFNPGMHRSASQMSDDDNNSNDAEAEESGESHGQEQQPAPEEPPIALPEVPPESSGERDALPGMPSCPITGEPMVDPVVAADGHSYERSAISRWLQTSDKSPLTGSVLPHKELVPNYGLLSSLQEQVDAQMKKTPQPAAKKPPQRVASLEAKPRADAVEDSDPLVQVVDNQSHSKKETRASESGDSNSTANKSPVNVAFIDASDEESSVADEQNTDGGS